MSLRKQAPYDLVVIGATAAALGLARTVKSALKTLIVNRTEMVAYEWVNCYKQPGSYTQGAAYCKEFLELEVDIRLGTEVISIVKQPCGRYAVELFGTGGYETAEARIMVDTTTEREAERSGQSLNALIIQQTGAALPELAWPGFRLVAEAHQETYSTAILKMACDQDATLAAARHQLVERWLARPAELANWRMAAIAFCFEEYVATGWREKDTGYHLLPSAYYESPRECEDAGACLGRSLIA